MHDRQLRTINPRVVPGWNGGDETVTTADIKRFFGRRRMTIAIPLVLALLAAFAYMQFATPTYTARAQVIIDPRLPQFLPGRNVDSVLAWDSAQVESEIAVLLSERVAGIVVTRLGLDKDNDFRAGPSLLAELVARLTGSAATPPPSGGRFREAISIIENDLSVHRTGLSYAIEITFSFPDAARAQAVANAIAEAYISDQLDNRSQAARLGGEWLQQRMVQLRSQMNAASQAVQVFRASHNYTIPKALPADATAKDAGATMAEASPEAKTLDELDAAEATYRRIYESFLQSYTESVQRQSFPVSDAHILTAASLPLMKSAPRGLLIYALAILVGSLAGFGLAIVQHHMDRSITSQEQITEYVGIDGLGTLPLLRRRDTLRALGRLFRRRRSADPGPLDEMRRQLVRSTGWWGAPRPHFFTAVLEPRNQAFSRAMMTVKVFLDIARANKRLGCVGITSAHRGEGTSTLTSNLGTLYATLGTRTLVIDADFGVGSLSRSVRSGGGPGLAEILDGTAELKDAVVPFSGTRLDFLPAAGPAGYGSCDHLLSGKAMASFLREVGQLYDIVIVDLPPVLPVGGVLALSPALDGLVIAVESDKSKMDSLVTLFDHFSRARAKVFGFAITKASQAAGA